MRRTLPIALAAAMALGNFAFSSANDAEPHLTDIAGDANFVNGQGVQGGVQQSGPLQVPGGDLQSITFETDGGDLLVHVGLDQALAAASPDLVYRVTGDIGGCPMMISANGEIVDGVSGYWRFTDGGACGYGDDQITNPATGVADFTDGVVVESTETGFTVRLEKANVPSFAAKLLKKGTLISGVDAHTRTILVAATVPVVDELEDPAFAGYKIGD